MPLVHVVDRRVDEHGLGLEHGVFQELLGALLELNAPSGQPAALMYHRQHGSRNVGCVRHPAVPYAQVTQHDIAASRSDAFGWPFGLPLRHHLV